MSDIPRNTFTDGPLGATYARTALPIIFVMGMNGLLSVTDALFLGHYVGPQALAAVTMMFPAYMVIVASATLTGSGMSSVLARHLGRGDRSAARQVFASAHGLAAAIGGGLILAFGLFGPAIALATAGGDATLADMGLSYMRILVLAAPLAFLLSVHSDALRNEGRAGFMAAMSLLVSLANIGFNYLLIGWLDMGVAGSAYGTVLAQLLAFAIIAGFRTWGPTALTLWGLLRHNPLTGWGEILSLGAPQSLNFIGIELGTAALMTALQMTAGDGYGVTVSAYGIVSRVLTFFFLPLLGLSQAMQSITGNCIGAGQTVRARHSLRLAIGLAFGYCLLAQGILLVFAGRIGAGFVEDAAVVAEVGRILPMITAAIFLTGPLMMTATHFQAIGDARRAALLGLSKPFVFAIPLTFGLALWIGETGVWLAGPVAEIMLLALTLIVLRQRSAPIAQEARP